MNVFVFKSRVFPIATLTALMVVINLLEMFVVLPIPLFKIGLANILPVYLIWQKEYKLAFLVNMLRVLVVSLLSGKIFSALFFLSFTGILCSTLLMIFLKFTLQKNISIYAMSIFGSVINNLVQYFVFIFLFNFTEETLPTIINGFTPLISLLLTLSLISGSIIAYLSEKLTPIRFIFQKKSK